MIDQVLLGDEALASLNVLRQEAESFFSLEQFDFSFYSNCRPVS